MKNSKHAYLIIAHNNFMILERLIQLLDDERNDIYIHVDKKVSGLDLKKYFGLPQKSKIIFINRRNVRWGGYSQILCELELLKAAAIMKYDYYHLLSGVDLPLKTQNYIHDFFNANFGKEFIHFDKKEYDFKNDIRVKYYHFLQGFHPGPNIIGRVIIKTLSHSIILLQALFRINRIKEMAAPLQKGANWFSITDSLARYILSKEDMIKRLFRFSSSGDEMFIQTMVWNSEYRTRLYDINYDNNYKACMRYVDWKRGKPYIWRTEDYDELIGSEYLFARKFDAKVDFQIVDKIFSHLMKY